MRLLTILILIRLLIGMSAYSQEVRKPIKWVVSPSFGASFPLTTLSGGHITDHLVGYNGNTYYGNFISSTYFFNRWGLEFCFSGDYSSKLKDRFDRFRSEVEIKYSGNYFISNFSDGQYLTYPEPDFIDKAIEKVRLGPVYKVEKNRWVIIGRAMIGITSFDTDGGSALLKGRGNNELLDINWSSESPVVDYFTFNPSFTLGYRVFDRVILDFDLNYRIYDIDFTYTETIQNLNTKEITAQNYSYSSLINECSVGFGLMIVLR